MEYTDASAFETEELDDGTLSITKYVGKDTVVNVPPEINGKAVTEIGEGAFMECESLTEITLPEGVTRIGHFARSGCS